MGAGASTEAQQEQQRKKSFNVAIPDQYKTYEQLQEALRRNGLESSNLIIGVDYTKSNTWTGQRSFNGKCLHYIDPEQFFMNPYQSVISIIGRTLQPFDDDNFIPVFGFGDATTGDRAVFPFLPDGRPCKGFEEVLKRYNEITPQITLSGPTNFAPLIHEAIRIVQRTKSYHILLLIADGQVTSAAETAQAIIEASKYPLSIVVVGVGDGPWEMMESYDDQLPSRQFDNFQFVDFTSIAKHSNTQSEISFATAALMEVPTQFKIIRQLGLL